MFLVTVADMCYSRNTVLHGNECKKLQTGIKM